MGKYVNSFEEFSKVNESLSTKDAKQTIKDIFDKFDGIVDDKYLKDMWKSNSTLRNLYGKDLFDKAWDELIDDGTIETEDGKEWCWCSSKKKAKEKETVNESTEYVSELMDKFDIDLEKAAQLDEIVDELLSMDDIDDRMDFVEGLTLEFDYEDEEDKLEEIMEYLKDMCIG
jgi:hypothetical protein